MRGLLPLLGVSFTVLLSGPALAEDSAHPTARLVYRPAPDTAGCPDEQTLRNGVSARLGYDPFLTDAPRTVAVDIHIDRKRRGLLAHVELRDAQDHRTGSRDIGSEQNDCGELASALTLAIAIAIDPLTLVRPAPAAAPPPAPLAPPPSPKCPPAPVCAAPETAAAPPPPAARPEPPGRSSFRAAVGFHAALGSAPSLALGFSARAGVRIRQVLSLSLEARGDLPAQALTDGSRGAETSLLLGSVLPCFHYRWLLGCAVLGAGALRAQAVGVTSPTLDQSLLVVGGVRLGVEIPVVRWLAAALVAEALGHVTPVVLHVDDRVLWTMPPLSGRLAIELCGNFL